MLYRCDCCNKEFECFPYVIKEKEDGRRKSICCCKECSYKMRSEQAKTSENKVCELCGKSYYVNKSQFEASKYCSHECLSKSRSNKVLYNCDCCGKEMYVYPYKLKDKESGKIKTLTCSKECRRKVKNALIEKTCEFCGKLFHSYVAQQRFCSKQCGYDSKRGNSLIPYKCDICGKDIEIYPGKLNRKENGGIKHITCGSKDCNSKARTKRVSVPCVYCGKEFMPKSKERKFCSRECYSANANKKRIKDIDHFCECCNAPIKVSARDLHQKDIGVLKHLTCSIECSHKLTRKRQINICVVCGKKFEVRDCVSDQACCSRECYYESRTIHKPTRCLYCGNTIRNKRGLTHFCGQECFAEYRKYISQFIHHETEQELEDIYASITEDKEVYDLATETKRCINCGSEFTRIVGQRRTCCCDECANQYILNIDQAQSLNMATRNSKPQLLVDEWLDRLGIAYERERLFRHYYIDNYLLDTNLCIEVMGDYWHFNINRYPLGTRMHEKTYKAITRDKSKHTYMKNKEGVEILYLWESDIINEPSKCEHLIMHYIKLDGVLDNYHSFNYEVEDGVIRLKQNLTVPYQEMDKSCYNIMLIKQHNH